MSKELKITKEKVLEASKQCEEARNVLKAMFPEAFEEEWEDITNSVKVYLENRAGGFRLFIDDEDGCYFAFSTKTKGEADINIPMRVSHGDEGSYKLELSIDNAIRILKKT